MGEGAHVHARDQVSKIAELYEKPSKHDRGWVPVLLEWLPQIENDNVRLQIIHAVGQAGIDRSVSRAMLAEFGRDGSSVDALWAAGDALARTADDSVYDDLVSVVGDPRFGQARQMVVVALGRMRERGGDALEVLRLLLAEEQLEGTP